MGKICFIALNETSDLQLWPVRVFFPLSYLLLFWKFLRMWVVIALLPLFLPTLQLSLMSLKKVLSANWRVLCPNLDGPNFCSLKVVTNEKGEAVGEVLTIIC
jgi:hypothetical protein